MKKNIRILSLSLASIFFGFYLDSILISHQESSTLNYQLEKFVCELNKSNIPVLKIDCNEYFFKKILNDPISDLFIMGNKYMISNDVSKAVILYQRSFELGNSKSGFMLGYIFKNGLNGEFDYQKSIQYFKAAGVLGHVESTAIAGNMIENGIGYQDSREALNLYIEAGYKGNFFAQSRLIQIYQTGINLLPDPNEEAFWKKMFEKNRLFHQNSYQLEERYWRYSVISSDPAKAEYDSIIEKYK